MMDMQPQGEIRPLGEGEAKHEPTDIGVRGIVIFSVGLIALGVVIHYALGLLMEDYAKQESKIRAAVLPRLAAPVEIPRPHLQADPAADRLKVQAEQLAQLNGYGWVDREAGIARIPIDRAMDILARTGLPEIKEPQPGGPVSPERHRSSPSDQRERSFQGLPGRNP